MVKALVIGANGFIGSALVDSLANEGFEVTAFDRFSSRKPAFTASNVSILSGDFLNRADIIRAVSGQDYVFHFLSTTTPASAQADPTLDIRTNVEPTVQLLETSVAAGVKRFFFASTGGAIYGNQDKSLFSESDLTFPVSPYAIGKLSVENYLHYFSTVSQLETVALRISNPFGSGQPQHKKQGLIPIAIRRALNNEPILQYGDGSMVRDYIFVDDLVTMITTIALSEPQHSLYNLGSGQGVSVSEVIADISEAVGSPVELEIKETPATFVSKVILDISRYTNEFGTPRFTPFKEGITKTVEAVRDSL